jgi:hypothetical protein
MSRRSGRPLNMRIRLMRFALWAQHCKQAPSAEDIASMLGVALSTAREWRTDWFTAVSPIEIENVPSVITLQRQSPSQPKTGQATSHFPVGKP